MKSLAQAITRTGGETSALTCMGDIVDGHCGSDCLGQTF